VLRLARGVQGAKTLKLCTPYPTSCDRSDRVRSNPASLRARAVAVAEMSASGHSVVSGARVNTTGMRLHARWLLATLRTTTEIQQTDPAIVRLSGPSDTCSRRHGVQDHIDLIEWVRETGEAPSAPGNRRSTSLAVMYGRRSGSLTCRACGRNRPGSSDAAMVRGISRPDGREAGLDRRRGPRALSTSKCGRAGRGSRKKAPMTEAWHQIKHRR